MIIYGKNVIKEAILNKRLINKLYLDEKFNDRDFLGLLKQNNISYISVSKGKLNELTANALHQGVVADVKEYQLKTLDEIIDEGKKQKFLILDELHDPQNLGAIIRTAEACKIDGIIISNRNQVSLTGAVAKTSAGAIEHVNVIGVGNIHQAILKLKTLGFLIVGTDSSGTKTYKEIPKDEPIAIVLGNEGYGIRPLIKKSCDLLVSIPMLGKVNSLNVSVVAALVLYQVI